MWLPLLLAAALAAVAPSAADLPVHCLNVQIAGTWEFELGRDDGDSSRHCGHQVPDTNADHFTKEGFNLEVVKKYTVHLDEPNIARDDLGNKGTWTMIYDEGFEVVIGGKRYFAFSKYVPKTPESLLKDDLEDYISVCDETLVGWFHDQDGSRWGCYHGKKTGPHVAPRFAELKAATRRRAKKVVPAAVLAPTHEAPVVSPMPRHPEAHDALWQPDTSFIELQNSHEQSTWRAGVHKHFLGKRMGEMMKLLGRRPAHVARAKATGAARFLEVHEAHAENKAKQRRAVSEKDYSGLPKSLDWRKHKGRNYDSPIKNQGNCGSCYAMAAISVAEARIRIMTDLKHKPLLSTQGVVSCSVYNQGCEGGYPYLVGKHTMDYGLVPQACMPYSGTDERCELRTGHNCPADPPRVRALNYSYIGGYYGACNEIHMMRELMRGPIMVAFDAPSSLFYYTGGIYTGPPPPHEGPRLKNLNPWEKTNHAVVAVGWGEEHGHKYWIVKNTWGRQWGENGYFRIRRGTDECGIESMAVTMDLILPKGM